MDDFTETETEAESKKGTYWDSIAEVSSTDTGWNDDPLTYEWMEDDYIPGIGVPLTLPPPNVQPTIQQPTKQGLLYGPNSTPPLQTTVCAALLQLLSTICIPVAVCYMVTDGICAESNEYLGGLIGTTLLVCGLANFMVVTLGIRLPVTQVSSVGTVAAMLSVSSIKSTHCQQPSTRLNNSCELNNTFLTQEQLMMQKMQEVSGALIVSSASVMFLGASGLLTLIMKFVGPLTAVPTSIIIYLTLLNHYAASIGQNWAIIAMVLALFALFAMFLGPLRVPMPAFSCKRDCYITRHKIFTLFSLTLSCGFTWLFCHILTIAEVLPSQPEMDLYEARTDINDNNIPLAPWFNFPYPFQWGLPDIKGGISIVMTVAVLSTYTDSLQQYPVAAQVLGTGRPPRHVMSRAAIVQGFIDLIAAVMGCCHSTAASPDTVKHLSTTQVGSRLVWQVLSLLLIVCGICGKVGAVLACIPVPVIHGLIIIILALGLARALRPLNHVDLKSRRNATVLGLSIAMGLMLPVWTKQNIHLIETGNYNADEVLIPLTGSGIFIAGMVAFLLDNILPGTKEKRGLSAFLTDLGYINPDAKNKDPLIENQQNIYNIPAFTWCYKCCDTCSFLPFVAPNSETDSSNSGNCCCTKNNSCDEHAVKSGATELTSMSNVRLKDTVYSNKGVQLAHYENTNYNRKPTPNGLSDLWRTSGMYSTEYTGSDDSLTSYTKSITTNPISSATYYSESEYDTSHTGMSRSSHPHSHGLSEEKETESESYGSKKFTKHYGFDATWTYWTQV